MALRYGNMRTPPALSRLLEHGAKECCSKGPAAARTAPSPRRLLQGRAPLCCAALFSHSLYRPCCVLAPSQDGETVSHLAAENGHVTAMEFLLAHGAYLNAKDEVRAPLESF